MPSLPAVAALLKFLKVVFCACAEAAAFKHPSWRNPSFPALLAVSQQPGVHARADAPASKGSVLIPFSCQPVLQAEVTCLNTTHDFIWETAVFATLVPTPSSIDPHVWFDCMQVAVSPLFPLCRLAKRMSNHRPLGSTALQCAANRSLLPPQFPPR